MVWTNEKNQSSFKANGDRKLQIDKKQKKEN